MKQTRDLRKSLALPKPTEKSTYQLLDLSVGNKGAISELLVCVDLTKKGFEVFRAVSPACSCDLVARKGDKIFTIEVRTAHLNSLGVLCNPMRNFMADIMASVLIEKNLIKYSPDPVSVMDGFEDL